MDHDIFSWNFRKGGQPHLSQLLNLLELIFFIIKLSQEKLVREYLTQERHQTLWNSVETLAYL